MALTFEQVRATLEPEEPDYQKAAKLGPDALPHLENLIVGEHPLLASKAAYLAGMIGTDRAAPALDRAVRSSDVRVRIAVAAAAQHLPTETASDLLVALIDDADVGVQKVALRSVPNAPSATLRARLEGLSAGKADTLARNMSREILGLPAAGDKPTATRKSARKPAKKAKPGKAKSRGKG